MQLTFDSHNQTTHALAHAVFTTANPTGRGATNAPTNPPAPLVGLPSDTSRLVHRLGQLSWQLPQTIGDSSVIVRLHIPISPVEFILHRAAMLRNRMGQHLSNHWETLGLLLQPPGKPGICFKERSMKSSLLRFACCTCACVASSVGTALGGPSVQWDNGPTTGPGGWFSWIQVDALGTVINSQRSADDFILADADGSGNDVVITGANFWMSVRDDIQAGETFVFEIYSDNATTPGSLLYTFEGGNPVFQIQSGSIFSYQVDFDSFAVALTPGVRYWAVCAHKSLRTTDGFREPSTTQMAATAYRIEHDGSMAVLNNGTLTQIFTGFQVPRCPPTIIESPLAGMGIANYSAITGFAQTGRISRGRPATTCETPTACNIFVASGEHQADLYAFQNTSPWPACIRVTHENEDLSGLATYCVAYSEVYTDNQLCTNYVGDPGSSSSPMQLSFLVSPGETFFIVVHEIETSGSGAPYTLRIDGLPECCTPTCLGDANQDLTVNFADITSVLANWLKDCSAVTVGTSFDPVSGELNANTGIDDIDQQ